MAPRPDTIAKVAAKEKQKNTANAIVVLRHCDDNCNTTSNEIAYSMAQQQYGPKIVRPSNDSIHYEHVIRLNYS